MEWFVVFLMAAAVVLIVDGRSLFDLFRPIPRYDYQKEFDDILRPKCPMCPHEMKWHSFYPGCSMCDCTNHGPRRKLSD